MAEERDISESPERRDSGAPSAPKSAESPAEQADQRGEASAERGLEGETSAGTSGQEVEGRPALGPRTGAPPRRGFATREGFAGRSRERAGRMARGDESESPFEEKVVKINRCATVVKGGRRFSFSALVVVGDRKGMVGVGFGKANEVPPAVEKASKDAKKNLVKVALAGTTIPHRIWAKYRSSKVVLVPAVEGTGVIAGAAVRAVVECAGIKDVLTKVYGSTNPLNVAKAALAALKMLRTPEEVARLRGVEVAR